MKRDSISTFIPAPSWGRFSAIPPCGGFPEDGTQAADSLVHIRLLLVVLHFWGLYVNLFMCDKAPGLHRVRGFLFAGIAQSVEQLICNQQAVGSSPSFGSTRGSP